MHRSRFSTLFFLNSAVSLAIPLASGLIVALPRVSFAATKIRIDSVAPEYRPTAGAEVPEPVSVEGYSFEVNRDSGYARLVVEYTYPDKSAFGLDGGGGPPPTVAQIPGLVFDRSANAVVYIGENKITVCATVQNEKVFLWKKHLLKATGACRVTSHTANHTEDNGWRIRHFSAIDVFFEVP